MMTNHNSQTTAARARTTVHLEGGGRTWWAHFEFTPINIEPINLRKKIEDSSFCAQSASARSRCVWKYQEGKTYTNAEVRNAPSRRKCIRATQAEDCRPFLET
jgi:hypothetical protein